MGASLRFARVPCLSGYASLPSVLPFGQVGTGLRPPFGPVARVPLCICVDPQLLTNIAV